jgi:hypothetical protein
LRAKRTGIVGFKKFRKIKIVGEWEYLAGGIDAALDEHGYYRLKNKTLLHREVYKQAYGTIPAGWVVHHIDFDKKNNDPINLIALPDWFHDQIHGNMKAQGRKFDRVEIIRLLKAEVKVHTDDFCAMLHEKSELERLFGEKIRRYLSLENNIKKLISPRISIIEGINHISVLDQPPKPYSLEVKPKKKSKRATDSFLEEARIRDVCEAMAKIEAVKVKVILRKKSTSV